MTSARWVRRVELAVLALVVAVIVGQVIATAAPFGPSITVEQSLRLIPGPTVRAVTRVSSNFAAHLQLTGLGFLGSVAVPTIDYYFDARYPVENSSMANWYGLPQHLESLASARHRPLAIDRVDASALASLLAQAPATGSILLCASGVLPSTVYSATQNRLLPWIRAGGIVVWIGAPIGAYTGTPVDPLQSPAQAQAVPGGEGQFLNASWLSPGATLLSTPSPIATGLNVAYPYGLAGGLLNASRVDRLGGQVLGYKTGGATNLARIPLGRGELVDVAAPVVDLPRLAPALLNLIETRAVLGPFDLLGSLAVSIAPGSHPTLTQDWPLPPPLAQSQNATVCAFAVETDYLAPLAATTCAPIF
ncbi:MAG: hypothetical protein ACYCPN_05345 [Thermoplasmata archaeon]